MAKNTSSKFVRPDADIRQAEAAKTTRLRSLRLAKEAADTQAAKIAKDATKVTARESTKPAREGKRKAQA